ncbi:MAG TPA: alpha/beta fold hydrolase [Candidatus Corynebacterium faecigallinarum]|uniref:Alpha/beta fold hydrolase n=1 Tax=Candidatus Corynebacterium faecigallinarum TaxID=2838528 RepID=A0A9D2QAZ9_9CORY|nr:alpha/beta fold hydrolase [Candidatus Corynebacterium faecigallinarum]
MTSTSYTPPYTPNHRHFLPAFLRSFGSTDKMPSGVNDWDSPLSEEHPVPVVLFHGTWMSSYGTWSLIAPELANHGYRVFALNYGTNPESFLGRRKCCFANGPLLESQDEVAAFIDRVLKATGAEQVDVIGHSQGSAQTRLLLSEHEGRFAGGAPKIRNVIGIAGGGHGTTLMGIGSGLSRLRDKLEGKFDLSKLLRKTLGQCAEDQVVGSDVVAHINRNGDTVPGVTYTMIGSKYDEIVTPWRIQFLEAGEGATAHNFSVQDDNPTDMSDHLSLLYSPRTLDLILERLSDSDSGEDGAYRRDHPMVTGRVLPLLGLIGKAGQVGR